MPDTELRRMGKSIHIWGEWCQPLALRMSPYIFGTSCVNPSPGECLRTYLRRVASKKYIRRHSPFKGSSNGKPFRSHQHVVCYLGTSATGARRVDLRRKWRLLGPAPWLHAMIRRHCAFRCANTVTLRAHPAKMRLPCATIRHQERPARRSFSEIARQGTAPLCPPPDRAQPKRRSIHGHVFPR